jgi:hypothetical protein
MFSMEPSQRRAHAAPFTLHWVWDMNEWRLAKRDTDGISFISYIPCDSTPNVVLGPRAGVIQPPPIDKPVYRPRIVAELVFSEQHSEFRERQTEIPQAPAGGNEK